MALRRFTSRQFDCNLKDEIVFNSIKDDKLPNLLRKYLQSSDQLFYEKQTTIYLDLFENTNE